MNGALGQTLPAKAYVACKFVIGGGKKTRQKYDPDMLKHFTEALRGAGMEEDRGASACEACQGMYKYQHDTDKDLKYLHVFPRVDLSAATEETAGDGAGAGGAGPQSPEYQCVSCTFEEFQDLVAMNVPSLAEARSAQAPSRMIRPGAAREDADGAAGAEEQEQEMYDSMVDVAAKVEYLNKELEKMVSKGRLTKGEQKQMVEDLGKKVEELGAMISTADAEGKTKKKEALEEKGGGGAKIESIAAFKPIVYTMANEKELNDLRKELAALEKIEHSGKLLKGDDLAKLAKKPRIEERIAALEGEDKGWFEDECKDVLFTPAAAKPAAKVSRAGKPAGSGGRGGWLTTAASKAGRASGGGAKKSAPSNPRGSGRRLSAPDDRSRVDIPRV